MASRFWLDWSDWRRAHQAVAARCHETRRAQRVERARPPEAPGDQAILPPALSGQPLSDADWERLRPLLTPQKPSVGLPRHDHRTVLSGILAVVAAGASWRKMAIEYGEWETAYKRHRLWCAEGRWQRLLEALGSDTVANPHSADLGP